MGQSIRVNRVIRRYAQMLKWKEIVSLLMRSLENKINSFSLEMRSNAILQKYPSFHSYFWEREKKYRKRGSVSVCERERKEIKTEREWKKEREELLHLLWKDKSKKSGKNCT